MKKILKITVLLITCMLIIGVSDVDAQYGKKKKKKKKPAKTEKSSDREYFDESGSFAHKLWYGGMLNFQISGNQFGNVLLFGISPMVGYKINDIFSIGPRATINQIVFYEEGPNTKVLEWGFGGFGRAKVFNNIFAHVEYSFEATSLISGPDLRLDDGTNFYLGGGYNSSAGGGGFGYEILILFNALEDDERVAPIDYRVGFTWNF